MRNERRSLAARFGAVFARRDRVQPRGDWRPAAVVVTVVSVVGSILGLSLAGSATATPGTWTQAQVNTAIVNGVASIDAQQNADGSFGSLAPIAETGMALVAYGVLANGSFASLPAAYQTHVQNAITWLLGQQAASGAWADGGFYMTYSTGIALSGLAPFPGVNAAVPAAITAGRAFLAGEFQGPPNTVCTTAQADPTSAWCGGWNYDLDFGRSDESNTGYAMFGLQVTGGVPAAIQALNVGWQNNVQANTTSNPTYAGTDHNDGGASYLPTCVPGCDSFTSNANNTGSMLFGMGYDGLTTADARVQAGVKFGQDVLNQYELNQGTANAYSMAYHTGAAEDGTCTIGVGTCDWFTDASEGGFHYSMFSLTKGLGEFIPPNLTDATNWYAKVVDLLLSQQAANGSWPADGRDDASSLFASEFSVASLGLVAVPVNPTTLKVNAATGDFADATTVSAVLTNTNTAAPVPGKSVTLTLNGSETCTATTDATGTASCAITPAEAAGTYTLAGSFAGDTTTIKSTGSANFVVTKEETALSYTGATTAVNGQPVTLSGVLTTDDPAVGTALGGKTVTFTLGTGGTAQSCSATTNGSGIASCSVASVNQTAGSVPVAGNFAGDTFYVPASTSASVSVSGGEPATTGAFVIGDVSAGAPTVGRSVDFWGAQWAKNNDFSGAGAPAAMKGFADKVPSLTCGATWTTNPGNSSNPPSTLSSTIKVIVSSNVTKSGSSISGKIVHIVTVQVNPGYGPNPGHAGTGKIVGVVC